MSMGNYASVLSYYNYLLYYNHISVMKTLVINSLSKYWSESKLQFVKLLKDTTNIDLKTAKDIVNDLYFSNPRNSKDGGYRITFNELNADLFFELTKDRPLDCVIITEEELKKEAMFDKIGKSVSFLQALSESANNIIDLKNEYDALKTSNEELIKENQSLKKTIYNLSWALTNYHSVHLSFDEEVQKAKGVIEDLRHEIDPKGI